MPFWRFGVFCLFVFFPVTYLVVLLIVIGSRKTFKLPKNNSFILVPRLLGIDKSESKEIDAVEERLKKQFFEIT